MSMIIPEIDEIVNFYNAETVEQIARDTEVNPIFCPENRVHLSTYGFLFWFHEKIPVADQEKGTQFSKGCKVFQVQGY